MVMEDTYPVQARRSVSPFLSAVPSLTGDLDQPVHETTFTKNCRRTGRRRSALSHEELE